MNAWLITRSTDGLRAVQTTESPAWQRMVKALPSVPESAQGAFWSRYRAQVEAEMRAAVGAFRG